MAVVYINIGTQKTGTTAIQSFMRENENNLHKQDCSYPYLDLGIEEKYNNRNGQFLVYCGSKQGKMKRQEAKAEVWEKGFSLLAMEAKKYEKIILSDELIWNRTKDIPEFWQKMKQEFEKIGCEVKVIVYLRRQDLFVESLWNQSVKGHPCIDMTFPEYIENQRYAYYPMNYYTRLCEIADNLGRENVIVRVFEKGQFVGEEKSIFSDFFYACGITLSPDFTYEHVERNVAIEGNYIEIKRLANSLASSPVELGWMKGPIEQLNLKTIEKNGKKGKRMFSEQEAKAFMQKYEEENALVAREFLGREDGILFYEPVTGGEVWSVDAEKMNEDMILFFIALLQKEQREIAKLKKKNEELEKKMEQIYRSAIFRGYRKMRGQEEL